MKLNGAFSNAGFGPAATLLQGGQKLTMEYPDQNPWVVQQDQSGQTTYRHHDKTEVKLTYQKGTRLGDLAWARNRKTTQPYLVPNHQRRGGAGDTLGITGALMKCVCSDMEAGYKHKENMLMDPKDPEKSRKICKDMPFCDDKEQVGIFGGLREMLAFEPPLYAKSKVNHSIFHTAITLIR